MPLKVSSPKLPSSRRASERAIERSLELIADGDYRAAIGILQAAGRDPGVRDLLGVCLMRSGEVEQAVALYRQFVLHPNSVLERPEVSDVCKRNFATALLMKGLPSGALEVLASMHDSESLRSVQIRAAIVNWERTLSFFRRLDWKLNCVEPPNCRVPIDFEPGEIEYANHRVRPDGPLHPELRLAA